MPPRFEFPDFAGAEFIFRFPGEETRMRNVTKHHGIPPTGIPPETTKRKPKPEFIIRYEGWCCGNHGSWSSDYSHKDVTGEGFDETGVKMTYTLNIDERRWKWDPATAQYVEVEPEPQDDDDDVYSFKRVTLGKILWGPEIHRHELLEEFLELYDRIEDALLDGNQVSRDEYNAIAMRFREVREALG